MSKGLFTWWCGGPQIGEVTCIATHPTYPVNVIKLKWEIIWTGGLPHPSHICPDMHAMEIMAKIARQLAIQIGCLLESGDLDENGRNGEKSPEGWRVYGNCLCLSCPSAYLAHEHACFCTMWMISCKRPILPLDINWKNYFSCCSAVIFPLRWMSNLRTKVISGPIFTLSSS